MSSVTSWPGHPFPLGAHWDGRGINFSIFSENAEKIELLLFNKSDDTTPKAVIALKEKFTSVWHTYIPSLKPPQLYAYRIHGPYDPSQGHRFNPHKVLIDPYARAIAGPVKWDDAVYGYKIGDPREDLSFDERDSMAFVPKSVVVNPHFDWEGDTQLKIPWNETIIYEAHVKGLSALHPHIDPSIRGSYAALGSEPVIKYLKNLGVTTIELLPVQHHVNDRFLVDKGLTNYWGYNTIGFFAPDIRYASQGICGEQVNEFKQMVKNLHKAGLEVVLDVVYNHTAEGNHFGPTLSFRGIDNAAYYRLVPNDNRYYMDFSGCGNGFNMKHPYVLQMIMDSLRYWITEMHVDGFRFDLAATLARELYDVDRLSGFFDIIHQDPIISQVKLIAEPWDLGPGGYQVGNFPGLWVEWNGKYRDTMRSFWKGDESQVAQVAYRLTGSSDLYQGDGRRPFASINFVTAHDGFTLHDLVSYNQKHNEANKDDNKDGTNDNLSWNCGAEGPTDDPQVNDLRERQKRNFLATLLLSQGVPMILGGDEISRSQQGNNNTYCQDNELNWFDWTQADQSQDLLEFTKRIIALRKKHPIFRRQKFFQGRELIGSSVKDLTWFQPNGQEMTQQAWDQSFIRMIGLRLSGDSLDDVDEEGRIIQDETFLLLLNAHHEPGDFLLPEKKRWKLILYTFDPDLKENGKFHCGAETFKLESRSLALFQRE